MNKQIKKVEQFTWLSSDGKEVIQKAPNKWIKAARATDEEIEEYVKANYLDGYFAEKCDFERKVREDYATVVRYFSTLIEFDNLPYWAQEAMVNKAVECDDTISDMRAALGEPPITYGSLDWLDEEMSRKVRRA